ncbi:hypothetical protein EPR50_G00048990 [Perca flavescens]|uniref:Uncharacterized protein n=1 Tax=Perca flavescens TaxID=8167 RepID=A0A484DBP2_PERFV|nr:hypothetical protein EPR50_G00048990 [Perca flavescens]
MTSQLPKIIFLGSKKVEQGNSLIILYNKVNHGTRPAPCVGTSALRHVTSPPHGLRFHAPRTELSSFHRERRRASGIPNERVATETRFSSGLTEQWAVEASHLSLSVLGLTSVE